MFPHAAREFVVGYGARVIEGDPGAQKAAFLSTVLEVRDRKLILFQRPHGQRHEASALFGENK